MRRRDATVKGGAPSVDLLVCFPQRAHLTVMPANAICSPMRPLDQPCPHHRRGKSSFNSKVPQARPSSVLWIKAKHTAAAVALEPTPPKATCMGQIKIKIKNKNGSTTHPCKGWQSVMHEIEEINKDENWKKQPTLGGFNKDAMQFLTCLWSLKFNFRCFGNLPVGEITRDDEEEASDKKEVDIFRDTNTGNRDGGGGNSDGEASSELFVVLQEDTKINSDNSIEGEVSAVPAMPPLNALLLMRCKSAPAKTWAVEADGLKHNDDSESRVGGAIKKNLKILIEVEEKVDEEERRKKAEEGLVTACFNDKN